MIGWESSNQRRMSKIIDFILSVIFPSNLLELIGVVEKFEIEEGFEMKWRTLGGYYSSVRSLERQLSEKLSKLILPLK